MVGTWGRTNSDSRTGGLGNIYMNHPSKIAPGKSAEKIKAHGQIHPNLNPAIIRKDCGFWEQWCSQTTNHMSSSQNAGNSLFFFLVGEQLLMVENFTFS